MRYILKLVVGALALVFAWFLLWHWLMAGDVAQVEASIHHYYQQMRTAHRTMSLEADAVVSTGFPFAFGVRVTRATLSMVEGEETFAISLPSVTLTPLDSRAGLYRVHFPKRVEALYAKNGAAPEHYDVTFTGTPTLTLRAEGAGAANAPLTQYALGLPPQMILQMRTAEKARVARFDLIPQAASVYREIPTDLSRPLQLFVGVLREALVFDTPGN
ncbi:MAG: hypothetical protein SFW64_01605 [Alphaproteobacteria bacterium]|nr:hypothetical protein [Alphaproteobacteria bacterium]